MLTNKLSSHWYDGVKTEDLVLLLPNAMERAEYTPDALEKEFWKIKVAAMEAELLGRQEAQDQVEV
jgi:hypothetical protein